MNLFRPEEHVRRWALYNPASAEGVISLDQLADLFGGASRRHLLDANYLSFWYPRRYVERHTFLAAIGKATPHWLGT